MAALTKASDIDLTPILPTLRLSDLEQSKNVASKPLFVDSFSVADYSPKIVVVMNYKIFELQCGWPVSPCRGAAN